MMNKDFAFASHLHDVHHLAVVHKATLPLGGGSSTTENRYKLEMWANAQRDGRPVEYRWRPRFSAAKFG